MLILVVTKKITPLNRVDSAECKRAHLIVLRYNSNATQLMEVPTPPNYHVIYLRL